MRIYGGVWNVADVKDEPVVELTCWRIFELPDGETHFMGRQEAEMHGRVSGEIMAIDRLGFSGQTKSGRIYKLVGPYGFDSDADYVWRRWLVLNKLDSCKDVSAMYCERWAKGTS